MLSHIPIATHLNVSFDKPYKSRVLRYAALKKYQTRLSIDEEVTAVAIQSWKAAWLSGTIEGFWVRTSPRRSK